MLYQDPNKLMVVDCDGVLVDWEYSFKGFMMSKGFKVINHGVYCMGETFDIDPSLAIDYIKEFNESSVISKMTPFKDSIKYVRKFHEEKGFVFHVITSLSKDKDAQASRTQNLKSLYGDTAIADITYLDTQASKKDALEYYRGSGCVWVEDQLKNAKDGADVGMRAFLMGHPHNQKQSLSGTGVSRVQSWKELYNTVCYN